MRQIIEVPAFLLEMSQQMHQQDNRMTAEPIWQVRCKRYLVTEQGYSEDHWEILHDDSEGRALHHSAFSDDYSELAEYLLETDEDWCKEWCDEQGIDFCESAFIDAFSTDYDPDGCIDLPDCYKRLYLQETEEVIKTCLTEADALAFIARKQHDYPKLYTYVESMVFCPQMIELRNWIMSLTTKEAA
ncbi:ead/Ea22-like family protein [Shewanella algae]|uniref:ead/Ea22-like family protein n=1 Tax=Shewanella algae TaxID=38313 RepID=UPI001AAC7E3F|nr:ead/Ea22-like family protein [Shewanella algae]MBO2684952.1 ead/Ea22-like family protein [Shewanella algae]